MYNKTKTEAPFIPDGYLDNVNQAIAEANSRLNRAGMPTYSDLLDMLRTAETLITGEFNSAFAHQDETIQLMAQIHSAFIYAGRKT